MLTIFYEGGSVVRQLDVLAASNEAPGFVSEITHRFLDLALR